MAIPTTPQSLFADKVNHVARLDNSLAMALTVNYTKIVLNESSTYNADCVIGVYNRTTSVTEYVTLVYDIESATINTVLASIKAAIEAEYDCAMTHSVTSTASVVATFNDINISLTMNDPLYFVRDMVIVISDVNGVKYSLVDTLVNPVELTPKMLDLTVEALTAISNLSTITAIADELLEITTTVVPNISEILLADTNAATATTKAAEALASANAAAESLAEIAALDATATTLPAGALATADYNALTGTLTVGVPAGQQGAQGTKGDTGDQGPQGPQGIKGDTGLTGPQGLQGNTGPQGPIGDTGPQGLQGIQGIQGATGATGAAGYTPVKGVDYFDGLNGTNGVDGKTISSVTSSKTGKDTTVTVAGTFPDSPHVFHVLDGNDGAGAGDMLKATYDTTNNGKVDVAEVAESVAWSNVSEKPTVVTVVSGTAPIVSSGGLTPDISISAATTSAPGSMSAADKTKLDGIATNANNYVLPTSVVHDNESGALHATDALRVSGTTLSLYKGDGTFEAVTTQDTVYVHPTTDGNLHVPATSTTNAGKVLTAGATAGSLSWVTPAVTDLTVTAGTTAGPTINSSTGADVVIPSASATASGVVTTGAQTFAGVKTMTSPVLVTPSIGVATGTSFNSITGLASVAPVAPAVTAEVGTSTLAARQDHVHPTNFTATATDIKMNGTQAVGTLTTFSRADHIHPTDTSRAPLASPTFTGTPAAPTAIGTTNTTQVATTAHVKTAYASTDGTLGGVVKMKIVGSTLYIRNDGTNA